MGNRDFFQIRAAKQGRYKLSIRRWQPGENLLKYYPTARRAELRGVERLISDNIWASAGSRTWGFTPWTSQIHGQCTSLLFKSDRVGFLPFVSKSILTNPHIHWSRGKKPHLQHFCQIEQWMIAQRTVKRWPVYNLSLLCPWPWPQVVSESGGKKHKGAL